MNELEQQVTKLNANIEKQLSFRHNFINAIVYGVGYAMGASIVAGIIIALLTWTINSVHDIPVIGKLVGSGEINFLK